MLFLLALDNLENSERSQIERLYHKYSARVKKLTEIIVKEKAVTDDLVNDTFVKVIRYKEKFIDVSEDEQLRMLIVVTRSVCFNYLKRKKKFRFESFESAFAEQIKYGYSAEATADVDLLKTLVSKETSDMLMNAINNLKDPAKDMMILKFYYEMKNVEIAKFYGINPSTVNTIIHRSVCRLRNELGGYLNDKDK